MDETIIITSKLLLAVLIPLIGSILVIVLTGIYTILGGLRAVVYTEALQTIILVVGSVLVTVFGLQALLPGLSRGAAVVVTASLAGITPYSVDPLYTLSKHAVVGLVRSMGEPLAEQGIRINAICPGLVKTDFARLLWEGGRGDKVAEAYPLKRLGEPEDIAGAAVYLAADTGRWITGQTIVLDGGGLISFREMPADWQRQETRIMDPALESDLKHQPFTKEGPDECTL